MSKAEAMNTVLDTKIGDMEFGSPFVNARIRNTLQRNGIMTLEQLVQLEASDLWDMQGLGSISISFILAKLNNLGLKLRRREPNEPRS
jgi:DNA-directed RNA polymerase alpha subunit